MTKQSTCPSATWFTTNEVWGRPSSQREWATLVPNDSSRSLVVSSRHLGTSQGYRCSPDTWPADLARLPSVLGKSSPLFRGRANMTRQASGSDSTMFFFRKTDLHQQTFECKLPHPAASAQFPISSLVHPAFATLKRVIVTPAVFRGWVSYFCEHLNCTKYSKRSLSIILKALYISVRIFLLFKN